MPHAAHRLCACSLAEVVAPVEATWRILGVLKINECHCRLFCACCCIAERHHDVACSQVWRAAEALYAESDSVQTKLHPRFLNCCTYLRASHCAQTPLASAQPTLLPQLLALPSAWPQNQRQRTSAASASNVRQWETLACKQAIALLLQPEYMAPSSGCSQQPERKRKSRRACAAQWIYRFIFECELLGHIQPLIDTTKRCPHMLLALHVEVSEATPRTFPDAARRRADRCCSQACNATHRCWDAMKAAQRRCNFWHVPWCRKLVRLHRIGAG